MHTSQTTHHRVYFMKVTNPDYLESLCLDLGMEKVCHTVYDLVLDEGSTMSVEAACRIAVKVAALGNSEGDPEDLQFMLGCIARLLAERRYTAHSTTFDADVDLELLVDQDISCLELFDLLSALSYGYEVRGIYSQWAMTSNKAAFGANAGGTRITMRDFSVPCSVYPDDAEGVIHLLAQHRPENIGDIYLMKMVLPLLEMPGILNKTMERSVHAALHRFLGGMKPIEEIIPEHLRTIGSDLSKLKMKDEYAFHSPAVIRKPRQAPTLDDFRNFEVRNQYGWTEAMQFYAAWFGVQSLPSGHCPKLPDGYENVVDNIRQRLAAGEELDCPAIHLFHNPIPVRIECEIPTIMPDREPSSLSRQLNQTGFEKDAVPLDPADLKDIQLKGVSLARSSQQDVLEQGRDVIDRETHRPVADSRPSIPSVMVLEKSAPDYSEVSSSRQSFAEPSPPSSVENSSSSDNNSSPASD